MTTTITLYAVLGAQEEPEDIRHNVMHDDERWAHTLRRRLDRMAREATTMADSLLDAPFRVVTIRCEVDDPNDHEEDGEA